MMIERDISSCIRDTIMGDYSEDNDCSGYRQDDCKVCYDNL